MIYSVFITDMMLCNLITYLAIKLIPILMFLSMYSNKCFFIFILFYAIPPYSSLYKILLISILVYLQTCQYSLGILDGNQSVDQPSNAAPSFSNKIYSISFNLATDPIPHHFLQK